MSLAPVTLDDKYTLPSGRVYLTGVQALVRLALLQRERDAAAGLDTGGFISGYRGSPLGGYDYALWHARSHLKAHKIHFQPGLNEDLAATSVWGTQQLDLFPGATVDGVFAIWYGKGPGVDRSGDVLKHGNSAGTSKHGGVLVLAGDDHACQSSTLAHQSEQMLAAAMIPVLNPASVQDYLDFGIWGFALSRYAGVWVGFKAISETVESSASVTVDPHRVQVTLPTDFEMPPGGLGIRWPDPSLDQEKRLHGPKMAAVAAFARANPLDRLIFDPPHARLGIMATGKAYLDVRQALDELGLDEAAAQALGIRLYKVGLSWPLEAEGAKRFADGLQDVIVVEEKRSFVEEQLTRILYNMEPSRRPSVVGKRDESDAVLLPSESELTPTMVARAIVSRLGKLGVDSPALRQRLARLESFDRIGAPPPTQRTPFFCSGCPHNTSTKVPEGSRAMAGIGCHTMAIYMPERRTQTFSHMGGEGAAWIGQAPFTRETHVFQNLGDGTYSHSGLLAVRAAAVAGVNITYKILYNDAVAMTGGQPIEGHLTVPEIARQVAAEGAKKIVVMSDEPGKYAAVAGLPSGVEIKHRDELDRVQRELRDTPGLTILIYDQTCAAEKRRRRKRGQFPDPPKRVFINDMVCEGCGDCSTQSNCISVQPLETELGRKRIIDQSSCNKDFSCLNGFCPSFVTVHGGTPRRLEHKGDHLAEDVLSSLPEPAPHPLGAPVGILVTGIGGTGVITLGALIGMAAHLEGKACTVLDFTGLAQKNGAVMSHVRLARTPEELHATRIAAGGADLVLGCDMVVAASPQALARVEHGVTRAVINSHMQPTAAFVMNGDIDFNAAAMQRSLKLAVGDSGIDLIDGTGLATALIGDSIATNLFMLGYAFQKGLIPLSAEAILRAIELNAVSVEVNKHTFAWGRFAAHDPVKLDAMLRPQIASGEAPLPQSLGQLVARRVEFLTRYQDAAYAQRYRDLVARAEETEKKQAKGMTGFADAVAHNAFKLMAYKDEYEVARLYTDGDFEKKLHRQFEGDFKLEFHLAPPLLTPRDPETGHLKKRAFGPWVFRAFKLLARLRRLRGTALDPFGRTAERRMERQLIADYAAVISEVGAGLTPDNHGLAVEIARLPAQIRGYGHIKDQSIERAKTREASLLASFRQPAPRATAAE
jgi:indolepyruvate ferredoxin oxidoreductase